MAAARRLHLTAFMRPVSLHTAAWRYPGAWPDANFNFGHIVRLIQKLEAGKVDGFFMADHLAVLNMPIDALKRSLGGRGAAAKAAPAKAKPASKSKTESKDDAPAKRRAPPRKKTTKAS